AGGSAAAQIVIVHRRQIVVHERVHVHELDGARRTLHLALREPECAGGGKYEGRPHAFASAEYAVAHCLVKSSRHERRRRQARGERALHALAPGLELRTVCLESGSARGASLCDRILHGGLGRARHTRQCGLGAGSGPVSSSSALRFATFTELTGTTTAGGGRASSPPDNSGRSGAIGPCVRGPRSETAAAFHGRRKASSTAVPSKPQ